MFAERSVIEKPISKPKNFHAEILEMRSSLKPASERQLGPRSYIEPKSQWKLIHEEFQEKMAAILSKVDLKK